MSLTKVTNSMISGSLANIVDFGADASGVASSVAAITLAQASNSYLYVPPGGTFLIDSNLTITSGVTCYGVISVASGVTLTINGPFDAPEATVFSGLGNVQFGNSSAITICSLWFSGSDIGVKINKALNSLLLGGVVVLPRGQYAYASDIFIPRTGYVYILEGQGINVTALTFTGAGYGINSDEAAQTVKVQLRDFELFGTSAAIAGIVIGSSRFTLVERVWVHGFSSGIGIWCKASSPGGHHTITLNDTQSWQNAQGLVVENIYAFYMTGGTLESNIGRELSMVNCGSVAFTNVMIENSSSPVDVTVPSMRIESSNAISFNGCYFEFNLVTTAVLLVNSQVVFSNCSLGGRSNTVYISNSGTPIGPTVIANCVFAGANPSAPIVTTSTSAVADYVLEQNCTYADCTNTNDDPFRIKAKGKFSGVGSITSLVASGVLSVVRNSTGVYTVTTTQSVPNAVYSVMAERLDSVNVVYSNALSAGSTSFVIRTFDIAGAAIDARTINFIVV
jgi:hypothetical protein